MSGTDGREAVTRLLLGLRQPQGQGETPPAPADAGSELFIAVYDELRHLARGLLRKEHARHSLRPTGLVHEAWIRLVDQDRVGWKSRAQFFGVAARAMRQILVDHARERAARKRGGGLTRVTLDEDLGVEMPSACEILDLHASLEKLTRLDARMASVVEFRAFAGMTVEEAAYVLGVSPRTVYDDWKFARLWLSHELSGEGS